MHGMRTYLWKQVKEPGVTRCWNSSDGVGDPKIWREWPAWSLVAVDQRDFSHLQPGHYRYVQGLLRWPLLSLLSMGWKIIVHAWTKA